MKRIAIIGACLFLFVLFFASRGMRWSLYTHPDEVPVGKWIADTHKNGYISDRLYPSGWFELAQLKVAWDGWTRSVASRIEKWSTQDGKVMVLDASTFSVRKEMDEKYLPGTRVIETGRELNIFLVAFSALMIFVACLTCRLHPLAAVFSGLLLGMNPFIMEHSHYCETDMGLVFGLVLSLVFFCIAKRHGSVWAVLLFAFCSGFAVSCKYTLAPLIIPAVAAPFLVRGGGDARRGLKVSFALAAACLALCVAGFVCGTPAIYKMPDYFSRVGEAFSKPSNGTGHMKSVVNGGVLASVLFKMGCFIREILKLGFWPLSFLAFSFAFRFRREYRGRQFNGPAFAVLFLIFFFTGMPWIRNQDILPMLVILVLASALPVDWAVREFTGREKGWIPLAPAAVLLFALAALAATACDGLKMTSFFAMRETRVECQNWLAASVPLDENVAADQYLGSFERGTGAHFVNAKRMEEDYPGSLKPFAGQEVRYYLKNVSHRGRGGNRDPFSGKLLPEARSSVDAFRRDSRLLAAWRVGQGRFRPAFTQPDVQLWAIPPAIEDVGKTPEDPVDIPVWFPRPSHFRYGGATLYGMRRYGPVGPDESLQTVGKRRTVRFSDESRQWAVTRSVEGPHPAKVEWESLARPRKAALEPGGAEVFEFGESALGRGARTSCMPGARVRMRGDDQHMLVLTSHVTDIAEAAFLLRSQGEPGKALGLLKGEKSLSAAGKVEAFRAAAALGAKPEAEWVQAAKDAVLTYERAVKRDWRKPLSGVTICGAPADAVLDFSRLRISRKTVFTGGDLNVFLPKGRYNLKVLARGYGIEALSSMPLFNVQPNPFKPAEVRENGDVLFTGVIGLHRGARLKFDENLPNGRIAEVGGWACSAIEISWDPCEILAHEIADIKAKLE